MTDEQTADPLDTPLGDVLDATARKKKAAHDAEQLDKAWRAAIRRAIEAGERVALIAEAAEISRDRVYQIRDDRR